MTRRPIALTLALPAAICVWTLAAPGAGAQEFAGREQLRAHSREFRQEIVRVTDGVYAAVGFDLGNAILIEGTDGLIIVDTLTGTGTARVLKAEFDKISTKPVKAIIYTHHHADHVGGATVFAGNDRPDVYAHERLLPQNRAENLTRAGRDGGNQFGTTLPESLFINAGIGPRLGGGGAGGSGYIGPTKTFAGERMSATIAGVRIELVLAPGETDDQIYVWLPDKNVLLCGDDFYRAFPNLYAIRGVPQRRVDWWVESLAKMIAERPEYLVPSHTRPILGAAAVNAALTAYHDGVKSVLDQTVAGIKAGLRPDELVARVKLPADLAANPYLQEFYGTVEWSVRAIYTYYLGWFDGNATNLFPIATTDRATRLLALAGGEGRVLTEARDAIGKQEFQWAAELTDLVLARTPNNAEARRLKAQALTELGERQISANARNFYLTSAQYLLRP